MLLKKCVNFSLHMITKTLLYLIELQAWATYKFKSNSKHKSKIFYICFWLILFLLPPLGFQFIVCKDYNYFGNDKKLVFIISFIYNKLTLHIIRKKLQQQITLRIEWLIINNFIVVSQSSATSILIHRDFSWK